MLSGYELRFLFNKSSMISPHPPLRHLIIWATEFSVCCDLVVCLCLIVSWTFICLPDLLQGHSLVCACARACGVRTRVLANIAGQHQQATYVVANLLWQTDRHCCRYQTRQNGILQYLIQAQFVTFLHGLVLSEMQDSRNVLKDVLANSFNP